MWKKKSKQGVFIPTEALPKHIRLILLYLR